MISISIELLSKKLTQPLPGLEAHLKMTPYRALTKTIPKDRREGAVMMLLYKKGDEYYFPLTLRHDYKGTHANQISFPGGKIESIDSSFLDAALRETKEEIGVDIENIEIVGELTQIYIPPSNFLVSTFVGIYQGIPNFVKEVKEVKEIIEVPLNSLFNPSIVRETEVNIQNGMKLKTPYLHLENQVVWGATAAILAEFIAIFKYAN
jgi:8-oxo-dGTP pyrophosphatase MutT (NUDIX family)